MNFYSNPGSNGGSACLGGNLLQITHRWHDCARNGMYVVTLNWKGFCRNIDAIVDDFGDLIPWAN